ncbi:MAG: hypothetical protein NTY77_02215 [Elusimicrobia bacterium]|nr:hypothetical protein [Elusimicrobiota bacterium]
MRHCILILLSAASLSGCQEQMTFGDLDRKLGVGELCAALRKGDPAAAAVPLEPAPGIRPSIPGLAQALLGHKDEPFRDVAPLRIFEALPRDQGPIESCAPGNFTMSGDEITKEMYLEYPRSRQTITLRYRAATSPRLKSFVVGGMESRSPGQAPPDAEAKRVARFVENLDRLEKGLPVEKEPVDAGQSQAPRPGPRFVGESDRAYNDWSALEKRFLAGLRSADSNEWAAVQADAAALTLQTRTMLDHLAQDTAKPAGPASRRPAYYAQAKVYAESLDRCATQLLEMSQKMQGRSTRPDSYPDAALVADMERHNALKLELQRQTFALRDAR